MTRDDPPSDEESRQLQEIFVSVTGEISLVDRQEKTRKKKVINATGAEALGETRFDGAPAADGLEDTIDDPEPG